MSSARPAESPDRACRRCERPPCADGCVAGAIRVNGETGTVEFNEAKCVGCRACLLECPFGAATMVRDAGGRERAARFESRPSDGPAEVRRRRVRAVFLVYE